MNGPLTINGVASTSGLTKNGWTYYQHIIPIGSTTVTVTGTATIDELRLYPTDAQMTTYTYAPVLGLTSICSPNDTPQYYVYYALGRLRKIVDQVENPRVLTPCRHADLNVKVNGEWGSALPVFPMGNRDEKYQLNGFIEMDEGFFEGHRKKDEECLTVKPAKAQDRQVKAIVAVSTTPIATDEIKKGHPVTKPGYLKMNVVHSLSKMDITYEAKKMLDKMQQLPQMERPLIEH
jgi:hypothetical protein